ncbi:MAG: hypothetical protein KBT19_09590 [Lachnospiraceae bacterium]|nr:hypothetical protein [Candidatus Colinaster equi]
MQYVGIVILLIEYFAWAFMTIAYKSVAAAIASVICSVAGALLWRGILGMLYDNVLFIGLSKRMSTHNPLVTAKKEQIDRINIALLVFNSVLLLAQVRAFNGIQSICMLIANVIWMCVTVSGVIMRRRTKTVVPVIEKRRARDYIGLIVLIVIACLLTYDANWRQFKWDGFLYYMSAHNINVCSISSTAIYGHIAQSFGVIVGSVAAITHAVMWALQLCNFFALVIMIVYSYKMMQYLLEKYGNIRLTGWQLGLLSSVCAFSPFYLGMVNYYSLDYYLMCFAPMFVYYLLTNEWGLTCVAGCIFVFTKEPAVIFYAGCVLGQFIVEIVKYVHTKRNAERKNVIVYALTSAKNYYLALPLIIWILTYKLLGPWSAGDGGLVWDVDYVIEKLKCLYVLNFGWLFVVLIVLGIVCAIVKSRLHVADCEWLVPILLGTLCATCFSCLFKTVNHPRYVDAVPWTLYIVALVVVVRLLSPVSHHLWQGVAVILAGLMLVSMYVTIDMVSLGVMDSVNVGTRRLIRTMEAPLGDGSIYNKQMLGLEHVMNEAFAEAVENGSTVIMPNVGDSEYYFDGTAYYGVRVDDVYYQTEYWDDKKGVRHQAATDAIQDYVYGSEKFDGYEDITAYTPIQVCMTGKNASMAQIDEYLKDCVNNATASEDRVYTIIYINDDIQPQAKNLCDELEVCGETEYNYRGWTLHAVTGAM